VKSLPIALRTAIWLTSMPLGMSSVSFTLQCYAGLRQNVFHCSSCTHAGYCVSSRPPAATLRPLHLVTRFVELAPPALRLLIVRVPLVYALNGQFATRGVGGECKERAAPCATNETGRGGSQVAFRHPSRRVRGLNTGWKNQDRRGGAVDGTCPSTALASAWTTAH
jgi:hypothetical protein